MTGKLIRAVFYATFAFVIVAGCVESISAQGRANSGSLWRKAVESRIARRGERRLFPDRYAVFSLNESTLKGSFAAMPLEFTADSRLRSVILEFPMPDGTLARFRVEDSPVLAPHLAADFPGWKTFAGYGIDDPTATGRFDWTGKGFHGYLFTRQGVVYIEPFQEGDTANYLVFYRHEFGQEPAGFSCRVHDRVDYDLKLTGPFPALDPDAVQFTNGGAIRTYRIAVATTGEWARGTASGSTDPNTVRTAALGVLTTNINRLDGIYRRELAVSLQLVNPSIANNATNIIFDDPATDPYDNTDNTPQLAINQTTLNTRVGNANFDLGHLFGTGGGGVASSPVVCDTNQKGEGYSARSGFYGDPFVVDYVAHEVGHQFGGQHTYNNSDMGGACTTRSNTSAYEVGSGSTIMSYVGICNIRNLQQYVDAATPYFHIRSLTEMITYLQTGEGNTCGTAGVGGNNVPTVNPGGAFTIPRLTPFTLTATGGDGDAPDVPNLLYSWEEYDLAPSASGQLGTPANTYDVDTDGVLRPLFRAYSPVASNARTFPSLYYILNPAGNSPAGSNNPPLTYTGTHPTGASGAVCEPATTCVTGENLPSVARVMNFRVSLRDRRGGMVDAGTTVTVAAGTGPFRVTTQDIAVTWAANSQQTVTWDVAGTTANGINTANVKISLSTNGGQTFPTSILASTANDGSELITVPNTTTTQARIKVEAVGNIFFDINNANFAITGGTSRTARADFDGDGKSDLSVYRPSASAWYLLRSTAGFTAYIFGLPTDVIMPGDYDGDHKADVAVWRPSDTPGAPDLYILRSSDNIVSSITFGSVGDLPVAADYDGDGKTDVAIWRPTTGEFYILQSQSGTVRGIQFGINGDKPTPGDYDGDNKADISVFRPSNGIWYTIRSIDNTLAYQQWGTNGDVPVFADYDGDTKDDVAVFRPSAGTWYILKSSGGITSIQFGANGDVPAPGDFDGDGKADQGVFRSGVWYLNNSTTGFTGAAFGQAGDIAVPRNYLPQ